jgi:hypothetical protein
LSRCIRTSTKAANPKEKKVNNQNQSPANYPFSVRLANGKEQTFASAAEMAKWMQAQRELDYAQRPAKRKPARKRPAPTSHRNSRWANLPPLARFAKTGR